MQKNLLTILLVISLVLNLLLGIALVLLIPRPGTPAQETTAPTSVTTLNTEERRKGIAYFRMSAFGDVSHLYAAGQEPAFAARFCETYHTPGQRRDP